MAQISLSRKVGLEMFKSQMGWTIWYLGIMLLIHIIQMMYYVFNGAEAYSFYSSYIFSANIYMFVIGIVGCYGFLPSLVHNGITRKDFFKGGLLAAFGLSAAIPVISLVVAALEYFLLNSLNVSVNFFNIPAIDAKDTNNILAELLISVVYVPGIVTESGWILPFLSNIINLYLYYVIGWMICAGFYRLGWFKGLGITLFALVMFTVRSILWEEKMEGPIGNFINVQNLDIPLAASFIGSFVLIGIVITIIRMLTSRVTIRL